MMHAPPFLSFFFFFIFLFSENAPPCIEEQKQEKVKEKSHFLWGLERDL